MSQPPWTPQPGDDPDDERSYRGAHSSGDGDDSGAPAPWVGGGSGGGDDQPAPASSGPDPWAGAKSSWSAEGGDDSGYSVPAAPPVQPPAPGAWSDAPPPPTAPDQPAPAPWTVPPATSGYGPPSYGNPGGPAAGPAVGEPTYAPGGYDTQGQPQQAPPPQPYPHQPFPPQEYPQPEYAQPEYAQQGYPQQPPAGPEQVPTGGPTGGEQEAGGPFRAVRPDAVPPGGSGAAPDGYPPAPTNAGPPRGQPPGQQPGPSAADVYTPAEAPPTPRPPQPELPDSMSDVPQYAARLAPAPLPDSAPHPDPGPGGWPTGQSVAGQQPNPSGPNPAFQGDPGQGPGQQPAQGWPTGAPQGPPYAAGGTPPPPPIPRPEDLLVATRPRTLEKPASWGWRGRLSRMTGGLYKPKATAPELADRQARLAAQRGFSRPMTVVVIQPKGGAGKTPTTICVASALGVRRGGYIVGWDNNETRGTLAVRTTNDDNHRTTAWDLLGRLDEFERPDARVGDLSYYMRAQGEAQFDALVSDDNPGNMAQIGEVEFKRIHSVLQRFYRMIIIDTGNNVRSTNWQAAVDHADQIVVVSTYQRDVGYSGSWVLDHLMQTGRDELARDAITVLTAAEPSPDEQVKAELVKHFGARTRAVVEVPYDSHIAEGGPIRWDELSEASKRAWTGVAAAITQTLYDRDQRQLTATGRGGN